MFASSEIVCAFVAVAVYLNTFGAEFVYDDSRAILRNRDVLPETPLYSIFVDDFWGTRMMHSGSHRSYRPITVLSFKLNYAISGFHPWSFHVTNVLLHALTAYLFVVFLKTRIFTSIACREFKSLFSGLLFAVHPIHTEAVSGVVGRADVLASLFVLATLLSYAKLCDVSDDGVTRLRLHDVTSDSKPNRTKLKEWESSRRKNTTKLNFRKKRSSANRKTVNSKGMGVQVAKGTDDDIKSRIYIVDVADRHSAVKERTKNRNSCLNKLKSSPSQPHQNNLHSYQRTFQKYISCLLMYVSRKPTLYLPYLFAVCALLSKELGACALPLCVVYDLWLKNRLGLQSALHVVAFQVTEPRLRRTRKRIRSVIIFTILLLSLRIFSWSIATGSGFRSIPSFSPSDNPTAASDFLMTRTLTFHYLLAFNVWLLIVPLTLSFDWSMDSIPPVESLFDSRNLSTFALYTFLLVTFRHILEEMKIRDDCSASIAYIHAAGQVSPLSRLQCMKAYVARCFGTANKGRLADEGVGRSRPVNEAYDSRIESITAEKGDWSGQECIEEPFRLKCHHRIDTPALKCNLPEKYDLISNRIQHVARSELSCEPFCRERVPTAAGMVESCRSIEKFTGEPTNSSGYATESSLEEGEREMEKMRPLMLPDEKMFDSFSNASTDDNGSMCSETSVETLSRNKPRHGSIVDDHFSVVIMSMALSIISFLPATNLFFYVGFVVAERILYLPSMGLCILVVEGGYSAVMKASSSLKRPDKKILLWRSAKICCVVLLVAFAARTIQRNEDWKNEYNLYRSSVVVSPAKSWANLGNVLKIQKRIPEAESAYLNALKHRGNMADVHYNLGLLYQEQRHFKKALARYDDALLFRPTLAVAHLNRGVVLAELGRVAEAEAVYRHCAEIEDHGLKDPQGHARAQVSSLYNLGCLLADQDRHSEAVASFTEAVRRRGNDYEPHSLFNMLGQSLFKLQRYEEAEKWFLSSLSVKPQHVPVHLTYARLLSRLSRTDEAERLYKSALRLEPKNHVICTHFAKNLMDQERYEEAAKLIDRAVETNTGLRDFDTVMTAANAYRQVKLFSKAEEFYRKATVMRPKSEVTHVNLGAILHLQGKYEEARASYVTALTLRPGDVTATTNLANLEEKLQRQK